MRLIFFLFLSLRCLANPFVTYEFSGGRFGDCLLSYLHAKWLCYKYDLPLLYKPFPYSNELFLDEKEERFELVYPLIPLSRHPFDKDRRRVIYSCPFFAEDPSDRWINPNRYRFDVDWKDPEFKRICRGMIAPKKQLELINPPKNRINIAIHIREGGGYDTDHTRLWDPLKLPPIDFYIQGLVKMIELFKGEEIYCYLFTDALEPALLAQKLQEQKFIEASCSIEFRTQNNHPAANVLEDFFSFFNFDALIHPQSNYSLVPASIGDFAAIYSPIGFNRSENRITITQTQLAIDEQVLAQVFQRIRKGL